MPRRLAGGRPEGVGTDYLTDNQLYERVGQADAVYIERKPPDLLGLIPTKGKRWGKGARENVLRRIIRRMKEGQSRTARETRRSLNTWKTIRGDIFIDPREPLVYVRRD